MSAVASHADLFFPASYHLAESPLWCPAENWLAFVDIMAGAIHRLDVSHRLQAQTTYLNGWVSAIAPAAGGRLLVAAERGLGLLDLKTDGFEIVSPPDGHLRDHRYNDGKCDRRGRFIVGTMRQTQPREPSGVLYSFDGKCRSVLAEGIRLPNAICFSPDGTRLYACDTSDGTIWSFAYNSARGVIGVRTDFAPPGISAGKPDGATVDADGCVWSARYNGGAVVRITPDGKLDRVVHLPVSQITSCTFGGTRLDTLFITTARQNLTEEQLAAQPLAGSLFAIQPGVGGIVETPFDSAGLMVGATDNRQE